MRIIMFSGKARVGKTTAAKKIAELAFSAGMKPIFLPFAKPIKDKAAAEGYTKEDAPQEYRAYCQLMGETKRKDDPDYWIKAWKEELLKQELREKKDLNENLKHWERVIIVDDCRYPNEIQTCKELGAILCFVSHGGRSIEDEDSDWREHESETWSNNIEEQGYSEEIDYWLENNLSERIFEEVIRQESGELLGIGPNDQDPVKKLAALLDKLIEQLGSDDEKT